MNIISIIKIKINLKSYLIKIRLKINCTIKTIDRFKFNEKIKNQIFNYKI